MTDLIERAKEALNGTTPGIWGAYCDVDDGFGIWTIYQFGNPLDFICEIDDEEDARLIALAPDLARLAVAAGELADLISDLLETENDHMTEWDIAARAALARFRAIAEAP